MEKKKKISLAVTLSVALTAMAVSFVGNRSSKFTSADTDFYSWYDYYHYLEVPATIRQNGCKEYWTNCKGETFTEEPSYIHSLVEKGTPSQSFVRDLDSWDARYIPPVGQVPVFSAYGNEVTYGIYPQTYVGNTLNSILENSMSSLGKERGWYVYNNEYYARNVAEPFVDVKQTGAVVQTGVKFADGTTMVTRNAYWFKVEPITWTYSDYFNGNSYGLSSDEIVLSSKKILDAPQFLIFEKNAYQNNQYVRTIDGKAIYSNNYQYSNLRAWLNGYTDYCDNNLVANHQAGFLQYAFSNHNSYIMTKHISNQEPSNVSPQVFLCDDTEDPVFIPSYTDCTSSNSIYYSKAAKPTDYALSKGAKFYGQNSNGYYLTRSPSNVLPKFDNKIVSTWYIEAEGTQNKGALPNQTIGVRPSIVIKKQ